jgi:hypothetical protein
MGQVASEQTVEVCRGGGGKYGGMGADACRRLRGAGREGSRCSSFSLPGCCAHGHVRVRDVEDLGLRVRS